MSDQGAEGTQTAAEPQAPQVDLGPVVASVEKLGQEFTEFRDSLQEPAYDPYGQQEPGYTYGEPDPYQGGPQYDQYGNPVAPQPQYQQGPDQGQPQGDPAQQLQQMIGQAVQQALAPVNERFAQEDQQRLEQELDQQAKQLEEKYPEFAERGDEIEGKAFENAQQWAGQIVRQIANGMPAAQAKAAAEDLARAMTLQPGYLEQFYLASKAGDEAAQETPAAASQEFQLEAAGGAAQPGHEQGSEGSQYLGTGPNARERTLNELWG